MKSNWIKYVFIIFVILILIFAAYIIKKDEAEKIKAEVKKINDELAENEKLEAEYSEKVTNIMM